MTKPAQTPPPGPGSPVPASSPAPGPRTPAPEVIESAIAVLALLDDLIGEFQALTLDQISRHLTRQGRPTPKATLLRQLNTLEQAGWITTDAAGKYRPSARLAGAAVAYLQFMKDAYAELRRTGEEVEHHAQERINRATTHIHG